MTVSKHNDAAIAPARLALYDDFLSCPRIVEIQPCGVLSYLDALSTQTYTCAKELGGKLPFTVIRELCENFVHADFAEVCVSVYDGGNTICFSDQGPGISNKELALEPGVTSATQKMKQFIRGVGSGLPISREYMSAQNGVLKISDNIDAGCIVLISLHKERADSNALGQAEPAALSPLSTSAASISFTANDKTDFFHQYDVEPMSPRSIIPAKEHNTAAAPGFLSAREVQTLRLIESNGIIGPTALAKQLNLSTATAYRLLKTLEQKNLILCAPNKKRLLTQTGLSLLTEIR